MNYKISHTDKGERFVEYFDDLASANRYFRWLLEIGLKPNFELI
jgi:hypothetical protein